MDVHFYHGWGCDASIWEYVIHRLPDSICIHNHDRGYFQNVDTSDIDTNTNQAQINDPHIVVTHSMGLLTVPYHILSKTRRLVVVNGFVSFCSNETAFRKEIESVLGAMIIRTRRNPALQINEFRKNAGFDDDIRSPYYNTRRLVSDLEILKHNQINIDAINEIEEVVFISDDSDTVVSSVLRKELVAAFRNRDHKIITNTKHLAPLRVPDLVVQCILGE